MSGILSHIQGSEEVERGPFTRAYSTQYVSVMFIVLTFVIGSFLRHPEGAEQEKSAEPAVSMQPIESKESEKVMDLKSKSHTVGEMHYVDELRRVAMYRVSHGGHRRVVRARGIGAPRNTARRTSRG